MNGLLPLAYVAKELCVKPSYVRKIAVDQGKHPDERRYPESTHERFPIFTKDGNGKKWVVPATSFAAHMRKRNRTWEPPLN